MNIYNYRIILRLTTDAILISSHVIIIILFILTNVYIFHIILISGKLNLNSNNLLQRFLSRRKTISDFDKVAFHS